MHREHRSKRGRAPGGTDYEYFKDVKRRKQEKHQNYLLKYNIQKAYEYNTKKGKIF